MDNKMNYQDLLFIQLVKMFEMSVQTSMGLMEDPISKEKKVNLEAAKLNLDMLIMLKDKADNNIPEEIKKYLKDIIAQFQLKYLEMANAESNKKENNK